MSYPLTFFHFFILVLNLLPVSTPLCILTQPLVWYEEGANEKSEQHADMPMEVEQIK